MTENNMNGCAAVKQTPDFELFYSEASKLLSEQRSTLISLVTKVDCLKRIAQPETKDVCEDIPREDSFYGKLSDIVNTININNKYLEKAYKQLDKLI